MAAIRLSFSLLIACGMVACGDKSSPLGPTSQISSVTPVGPGLSSTVRLFSIGETAQLSASVNFVGGRNNFVTSGVTWRSSNQSVVTVSSTGLVTARAAGRAQVSAVYEGHTGTLDVSVDLARVVPILLWTVSYAGGTPPTIRATFQGRAISSNGYHVFNLQPGTYELTGTLVPGSFPDSRDAWAVAFSTFRGIGDPPPITDNGVQINSISSLVGPNPTFFSNYCEMDYTFSGSTPREFRISFVVTASRAAGTTCPPET
jgi:hypothetical protein